MAKPDKSHEWTDRELASLEKRIATVYKDAAAELDKTISDYFAGFAKRDAEMKDRLDAGEIDENYYRQWRLNQMGRGERFQTMRDRVAERMTNANEVARAYVNDDLPSIYALNRNFTSYTIEKTGADVDFALWDEQVVKRAILEEPDLMPYYPPEKAVARGIDLEYGKKKITQITTSSIIQGLSIPHIADRLQKDITTMNRNSAIRTARTAVTEAENAARQDGYEAAAKMGVKCKKQWVAIKDNRTRHDHGIADGQIVDYDKPFTVGGEKLMYPADSSLGASPWNTINCRCTCPSGDDMEFEKEPRMMRVRNPLTGRNELIQKMNYSEWVEYKKAQDPDEWEIYVKKGKNLSADYKQYNEYRKALGNKIPDRFGDFQNLKYKEPDKWAALKREKRKNGS